MYLNTAGGSWITNNAWLGSDNHCSWQGVTCSASNSVTELNLENNRLSGPYPSDLSSLESLSKLNLSANSLTGTIPNNLCTKSSLHITGDPENCPILDQSQPTCCDIVAAG